MQCSGQFRAAVVTTLAAVLGVQGSNAGALTLSEDFLGDWHGVPDYSQFGPFPQVGFNFSIQSIGDSDSGQYLMHDHFDADFYFIPTSTQNFWIDLGDSVDSAVLHYCGYLYHFYSNSQQPAIADVKFDLQTLTDTQMVWCMRDIDNCAAIWTLTLSNDGQQLQSEFYLPQPITHLDVTYNKININNDGGDKVTKSKMIISQRKQVRKAVEEVEERMKQNGVDFISSVTVECTANLTSKEEMSENHKNQQQRRRRGGCPYGFDGMTSLLAKMTPQKRIEHKNNNNVKKSYDFCYRLNPVMDYILEWTFDEDAEELHVQLSIPYDSSSDGSSSWVALGIEPEWPYMEGMDIALGYPSVDSSGGIGSCVRSMYAEYSVGTPVDYSGQVLTDTDVIIDSESQRMNVVYTRPFHTGHHNISRNDGQGSTIMFATGAPPSNGGCDENDSPGYHFNMRGTFEINWWKPALILPSEMQC